MSNVNVESGETNNADNQATASSSTCEEAVACLDSTVSKVDKNDDSKPPENGADTLPKPVSRPPYIPPHLMGRDLNDPAQDMVGTGRRVQKPRLGVKVPYRNLTSQIVSQDEIAQEILERSLRKYSYSEVPEGGDVFFAMKLTHRLANKITPSSESCNDKAGNSGGGGGGDVSSSDSVVGAAKKSPSVETTLKRNLVDISAAVYDKTKETDGKTETASNSVRKNANSDKTSAAVSVDRCNEASKTDTSGNFESKAADQLYAEISSTLGEECKIGKPLKMACSPVLNSHTKVTPPRIGHGPTANHSTTEAELDNDTLLAILEGTSEIGDISINTTAPVLKIEPVPVPAPAPQPQPQQQPAMPPSQLLQPPQMQQQPPPSSRKKRIKPLLDPNVEKELALKQLMDFERKKNEDRLKKSAAKKLKLDEETLVVMQHCNSATISASNTNNTGGSNGNNNNNNNTNINNNNNNNSNNNSNININNNNNNDDDNANRNNGNTNVVAVEGGGGEKSKMEALSSTVATTGAAESTRQELKTPLGESTQPCNKKPKKSSFSGGSIAPKRFPKKYQRIIKRQLRSSKLKAKTASPDQQQQQQQQTSQSQLQKKLPEVPEVQIAIDRYIKTYASKRKHKPEPTAAAAATADVKEKAVSECNVEKNVIAHKSGVPAAPAVIASKEKLANDKNGASEKRGPRVRGVTSASASASSKKDVVETHAATAAAAVANQGETATAGRPSTGSVDDEIKENSSPTTARPKANSKVMREINRLLGDEGAINMIYSIEQKRLPDSKRDTNILPSLRRKKKDLLLKTKLVKNAVLRLSMSPGQLSPGRVRRTSPEINSSQTAGASVKSTVSPSRKASMESLDSNASEHSPKVRKVAAEASRIIRRHSSSSAYSSDEEGNDVVAAATTSTSVADTVSETAKTKSSVNRSSVGVVSRSQTAAANAEIKSAAAAAAAAAAIIVEKRSNVNEKVAQSDSTNNTKKADNRDSGSNNNNNNNNDEKENRVVGAKIGGNDENSVAERVEDVAERSLGASSVAIGTTCSSKRKDSKEGCVGVAAKTQSDSSIVSSYSELVERLGLKEITLRKYDNLVQIILISSSCKMKNAVNIQVFEELTNILGELQKDESCRTVLLTSTGSSFCQGIDLQALIRADKSERRKVVGEYVAALLKFTECLSQFNKILIAGVHGSAVGLGVTMLPFFDMVFASDKATFYTPYVKLGQIPEAGATLTLPHLLGNAVTSELLFGCRMLTASEALQFGLVTRILWPDKFGEELLPIARSVANNSSQSMEATKSLLRHWMNEKLQQQLITEAKLLEEHWSSDECQRRFKDYLQQEALLKNK